jgi:hypothetical protein
MKIVSFQVNAKQLTLLGDKQVFEFRDGVNIIFNIKNSVGKTTLLRFLMYALGYPIPSTRGIRFSDYETVLTTENANSERLVLTRNKDYIEVFNAKDDRERGYSLPVEQNELHSYIYDISNLEIIENLLGAFYIDQEKGWTLLNRGKAIGSIRFSIEALLRGLSNKTNDELSQRLAVVNRELRKYKHMLDIAAYKAEINKLGETAFDSPADDIENELELLYSERKPLDDELNRIKNVIRKNTSFKKFISSFKLTVKSKSGEEIPVNEDTLVGYKEISELLVAKQRMATERIAEIDRKIFSLKEQQYNDFVLADVKTSIHQFDSDIAKISVDAITTKKIITKLRKEKKFLEESVIKSVKRDNPLIGELHQMISKYAVRLGLDENYVSAKNDYIFTDDLKSLSGAIFHKIVFSFKISYVKLIQQQTNVCLPIILDSPSGREVSEENINEMIAILNEDFSNHQIIIASIYDSYDFSTKNIIKLQDRLLSF